MLIAASICISFTPLPARASETVLPAVKVAFSDDQSIIIQRVLREALKRTGHQMSANVTGMRTAVADVNYGDAAILPLQTGGWDQLYENLIKVPVAIDHVEYTAYTHSSNTRNFTNWTELSGFSLGYRWQNQYVAENVSRANAGQLLSLNTHEELWDSLLSGETEVVILPRMAHFEHRLPKGIRKAGVIERQEVFTYVNKAYSGLVPLLAKAYREMQADGTMELIHEGKNTAGDKKTVLHINSFSEQVEWERTQMEHIREFLESESSISYLSLNLDANKLHRHADYNNLVADLIRTEYIATSPDLIISSGDESLEFVINYWQFLFPNVPVVFFGVRDLDDSSLYGLEEYITGVRITESVHDNASLMWQLFPEAQRIYILNDKTLPRSAALREQIRQDIMSHGQQALFEMSADKPLTELLEYIRGFDSDTLILIGSYLSDSEGEYYSESSLQKQIAEVTNNPVFCLDSAYIGNGVLGGRVSGTDEYMSVVSEMAAAVLAGTPPISIPAIYDSEYLNSWLFDYETAKSIGIHSGSLPQGHTFINKPQPLWESNPVEFRLILVVTGLLLLIIGGLVVFTRELSKKQSEATAAAGAKSVFLAKMSNEIRTPMNAILGIAELALRENNINETRDHILAVKQAGTMLLSTITDILDFSKIESGTLRITARNYELSALIHDVVSITRMKMADSWISFLVNVDSNIPNMLIGDEIRIRQVLINILSNAVKYTKTGFIALNISGEMTDLHTVSLKMEIKDSGRGIKQEDLDKLFIDYFQVDAGGETDGVGLGLPITGRLVSAMGGGLQAESEYGTGSTFTVTLPQKTRSHTKLAEVENAGSEKILIYEQCKLYSDSITRTVENLGIECVVASSESDFIFKLSDDAYTWLFISSALYEYNKDEISKYASEAKIVLLSKIHDTVVSDGLRSLTMPIYSVPVANILDGTSDSLSFGNGFGPIARLVAPDAKVLVVDDVQTNLRVAKGFLISHLIQVDLCSSGAQAIEALKSKKYDLVFMDQKMPEMDGIETTKRIRALGKIDHYYTELPIIALTADAVAGVWEIYIGNGFNDYISKPIDIEKLNTILEKWLPNEKQKKLHTSPHYIDELRRTGLGGAAINGLDIERGIALSDGNYEYYLEMLTMYCQESIDRMTQIGKCLEAGDLSLYKTHVHAMKGASASVGATKLTEMAIALEDAVSSMNTVYIQTNTEEFIAALNSLVCEIQSALSTLEANGADEEKPVSTIPLKDELGALKSALCDMDLAVMNRLVDKLIKLPKTKEFTGIISKIASNVLMADYEKATELCDAVLLEL